MLNYLNLHFAKIRRGTGLEYFKVKQLQLMKSPQIVITDMMWDMLVVDKREMDGLLTLYFLLKN